jgi:hypothetical protein
MDIQRQRHVMPNRLAHYIMEALIKLTWPTLHRAEHRTLLLDPSIQTVDVTSACGPWSLLWKMFRKSRILCIRDLCRLVHAAIFLVHKDGRSMIPRRVNNMCRMAVMRRMDRTRVEVSCARRKRGVSEIEQLT